MSEELKACPNPWCTYNDPVVELTLRYMGDKSPRRVECECGMTGPVEPSDDEAIAAWNHRPTPHSIANAGEAMREAVARIISPSAWETRDMWLDRLAGKGDWPDEPEKVAMMRNSYERRLPKIVAPSLAQAAAILSLLPLAPEIGRPRITAAEINALPEDVRRYIMMLETECDGSGTIRSEMMLRDTVEALEKKRVDETWRCTCCRSEFQYDGEARPNCPHCKAFDQYTYRGGFAPGERLPSAPEGE